METDFTYSEFVTGKNFTGRTNEIRILANLLRQNENVVIYEPPKTGKTSLIQQTFMNMRLSGESFLLVEVSLGNVRTEGDFATNLGSEVLKTAASSPEEYPELVGRYLKGSHFVFDEGDYSSRGRIISLNWEMDRNDLYSVITLPYRIGADSGLRLFVIIDDFQNILLTEDGELLLKNMESIMKDIPEDLRKTAAFIFCGSRINAMKYIFEDKKFFHNMVERLKIYPIDEKIIADTATKLFLSNGKVADSSLMLGVCKLFKNNIWYINHFCSICNGISRGYIMDPVMDEVLNRMIAIHEPRFKAVTADLTTYQVHLLKAIVEGCTRFCSTEAIEKYGLNSSANVRRVKDALCKKEIVTFSDYDKAEILDPLFEYWVTKYFFEIQ